MNAAIHDPQKVTMETVIFTTGAPLVSTEIKFLNRDGHEESLMIYSRTKLTIELLPDRISK